MKQLLPLIAVLVSLSVQAQIVNSDFEGWSGNTYIYPAGWVNTDNHGYPGGAATGIDSVAEHGLFALRLGKWYGGEGWDIVRQSSSINYTPVSLSGYYKYVNNNLHTVMDTAQVLVYITRWNSALNRRDTTGRGKLGVGRTTAYTKFICPINYTVGDVPDSFLIYISPAKYLGCQDPYCNGPVLSIDNLGFDQSVTGVIPSKASEVSVHPNPVTGNLHVDAIHAGVFDIAISDAMGRTIARYYSNTGSKTIDVSAWNKGMYFLMIQGGDFKKVTSIKKD